MLNINGLVYVVGDPFQCRTEVIVVITGSPGIPEFYREFAEQLHRCTQLPVCVVGHAGHDEIKNAKEKYPRTWTLYNTEGQIEHKLDLLNNYFDKRAKLHVIGHSIGAWMLMELLHKNDHLIERLSSVNLLFPTLQKFAATKNGKLVNNFVKYLHKFILLFLFIIHAQDAWVPMHHIQDLKKFKPHVTLKQVNVEHAFVLRSSAHVANVVGDLIVNGNTVMPCKNLELVK
ncbi:hypothetical protein PYW08_007571 [Mythimna loreyi]|uniref:Uncharacterized protein n=1 Tax=Mythimna loreyi TaxID=667449 RepID=A0ACC2QD63_9NEOP|nr:hypothetical protein PYW08_007571 [Mythimna loreyi]